MPTGLFSVREKRHKQAGMYTKLELTVEYIMASADNFKTAINETYKIDCILMKLYG